MPFLPIGEWLPDQPDFNNPGAATITNVLPRTEQSYGPMQAPSVYSSALTARCQGSLSMRDLNGTVYVFAGDATKLYLMNTAGTFNNVSAGGGAPYTVAAWPSGFWSATTFGNRVIFTDLTDNVQTYLAGTDTAFSALGGSPPKAQYVATIRDFVMLASLSGQPYRVQWSAIGDPTNWPTPGSATAIQLQSDQQDLQQTELGFINGIVGGMLTSADGAVFCERGIYSVNYVGSPAIFAFTVAQGATGTRSPLSIVQRRLTNQAGSRGVVYYLGEDGFYAFDGAMCVPIGAQKIDKTFFNDLDPAYLGTVLGAADPINKMVFWAYSASSSQGLYNRLIVYNWDIGRWSLIDYSATPIEWLTRTLSTGYTLDGLDTLSSSVDLLPESLDSRLYQGGNLALGMFDSNHKLNYPTGANLAPTVETSETQPFPDRRSAILGSRPITDGTPASVSIGVREQLANSVTYKTAQKINSIGNCPQRTTGRYVRARLTLPAGTTYTHIQGVDLDVRQEGIR
jgi:hypothetical protein